MGFVWLMLATMLFSFGVLRAAVLTQPPITKIEEMGGLVHMRPEIPNLRSQILTTRLRRLHQANRNGRALSVTPDLHLHRLTDLIFVEHAEQIV